MITGEPVTLGRDPGNDFVIDEPGVSDFHAEVVTAHDEVVIIDLLSGSGTFVNGERISTRERLRPWDVIRIGTAELEIVDPNSPRPVGWSLVGDGDVRHPLTDAMVVGRDPACDLVLEDRLLSRRHARLSIEQAHVEVVDLGSANGTYVNGKRIAKGVLWPGDELRLGTDTYRLQGPVDGDAERDADRGNTTQLATEFIEPSDRTEILSDERIVMCLVPSNDAARALLDHPLKLSAGEYVLGRQRPCDVLLADSSVSKRHALLSVDGHVCAVEDQGSSNGTFVNGEPVGIQQRLNPGDSLTCGRIELQIEMPDSS